jgi:hypothetical protein
MRASSVRATAHAIVTSDDQSNQDLDYSLDQWVREPSNVRDAGPVPHQVVKRPAHPSNRLVAQLNATWRVVDDPLQWILQRKKGNPRNKNSGWRGRSFCRTRDALLRCIREYCGEVDVRALAKVQAFPYWHPDWDRETTLPNLDVHGTDQAQAHGPSKPPVSRRLEDLEAGDQPSHHTLRAHT